MDAMLEMSENDYNKNVINTWKEFAAEGEKHKINLVLESEKGADQKESAQLSDSSDTEEA